MYLEYEDFKQILKIGIKLSTEKDRNRLLSSILEKGMEITNCDAGILYLYENGGLTYKIIKILSTGVSRGENGEPITDMPPVPMAEENVCAYTALHREIVNVPVGGQGSSGYNKPVDGAGSVCYNKPASVCFAQKDFDKLTGCHTQSQLVIPLENSENELIGVLQLINAMDGEGKVIPFDKQYNIIIRSLGAIAAIELTNISYMEELRAQMYSFVEALTTALDERTPYNAAHTRNVEKYAELLADYISCMHKEGKCEEDFDYERKRKLRLAALLHDIGKIVVPRSIMNRGTRLDSQVRVVEARFEYLKALYEIDLLLGRITKAEYGRYIEDLESDLAFIHKIDSVGYLDDESYERVCRLAKKEHVREDGRVTKYITQQEADYLGIRRGTLTDKDRKTMENHVVMTEKILEKVRFHRNFADVPRWAAAHHEYLDGSGYPMQLAGDELDLETRILTVADIYDALTATDRPYKKPMSKEKAIGILKNMAGEGKVELRLVEWLSEAIDRETKNACP